MIINALTIVLIFVVAWALILVFALLYIFLEKTWRLETIEINGGIAYFKRKYVNNFNEPIIGKFGRLNILVSELFRDNRQFWKIPYYVMRGNRANLLAVYVDGENDPIKFEMPEVAGNIIKINKESTAINSALSSTFRGKTNTKLIIILLLLFIALMLGLSYFRSGGF